MESFRKTTLTSRTERISSNPEMSISTQSWSQESDTKSRRVSVAGTKPVLRLCTDKPSPLEQEWPILLQITSLRMEYRDGFSGPCYRGRQIQVPEIPLSGRGEVLF